VHSSRCPTCAVWCATGHWLRLSTTSSAYTWQVSVREMREERSGGGWAARYRVLLLLWALALVLLSNSMLGDVKSADMTEEELAGPGQIQHRAHSPLSSRKAQKPEPKVYPSAFPPAHHTMGVRAPSLAPRV
jgi:hypothetical protein